TPIVVTISVNTPGINFALDFGGSISGMVTDAATNAASASGIDIYDSTGNFASYGYTDSSGNYAVGGLPTGNYFAVTGNYSGYVDELYNNIICPRGNCDPTTGTPIAVTVSNNTPGINFPLDFGGSISGMITDAAT